MIERLTSRKNPNIRQVLDGRKGKGLWSEAVFPEGLRLCEEVLASDFTIQAAFFSESSDQALAGILPAEIPQYLLPAELFSYLSETKTPQGCLFVCSKPEQGDIRSFLAERDRVSLLVLESVQDPGNVGSIMRTAYALGIDGVILCGQSADPFQGKVLRAGMGATFHLPIFSLPDSEDVLTCFREFGIEVLAAGLNGEPMQDFRKSERSSLWVGNEGNGLSDIVLTKADSVLTIPMPGGAESLNVAAATAILIYKLQTNL